MPVLVRPYGETARVAVGAKVRFQAKELKLFIIHSTDIIYRISCSIATSNMTVTRQGVKQMVNEQ